MQATNERSDHLVALSHRLSVLEAEAAARRVMSRYMSLCDVPAPADADAYELEALFAHDAVWEGVGGLYASSFGKHIGPLAIGAFLRSYLPPSAHFRRNVHFLTSESLDAQPARVNGHWIMQQVSTYADGGSEWISARLAVVLVRHSDGRWLIREFRTERLASLPLAAQEAA
ncbi:polyketide cyclase [Cupriavidus sp. TA19]|uniref:nuclear transport factor 2 family protein n=1 Tax=unclassified Cupriavidus TaxID=2640874 RepID=UPI000E2E5875|nr:MULTISPECIES: nuclear transport factor 2 family protein [unclassified Cupriavidus]BDB29896.1 nuclear transport factor 2 family protein [Cupriavidus sp. P-10]GLC95997.1 polyketide cyclase [Cupriavidus sp. TA19]